MELFRYALKKQFDFTPSPVFRFKTLFVAGERCDVETLEWSKKVFRVPVLDHWWQTGEHFPHVYINVKMFTNSARTGGNSIYDYEGLTQDSSDCGFSRN